MRRRRADDALQQANKKSKRSAQRLLPFEPSYADCTCIAHPLRAGRLAFCSYPPHADDLPSSGIPSIKKHKARSVYSVERWDSALNRIAVAWSSAKKRRLHERASNEAPAAPIVLQPMQPAELN